MIVHVLVMLASVLGAQSTFYLIHHKQFSTVRASSGSTLIFALVTSVFSFSFIPVLQASFFGATFVGMTSKSRMGRKRVLVASLAFALIFIFVLPSLKGLGGGLGTAAFVSTTGVYLVSQVWRKFLTAKRK